MFLRIRKLLRMVNNKFILTMLLFACPIIFISFGCGTWNTTLTGPTAPQTLTATAIIALLATTSATPTGTITAVASCPNPATVPLNTAGNYTILTESGITDVHPSSVTGNVGNSPGSGTQILITCAEVTGTIFAVDAGAPDGGCDTQAAGTLTTAITDMTTAYTTANGLPYCVLNLNAGILSGLTLTRGTYKWTNSVTIPTNLHLDALGDPTATWVFQIAGTLDLSSAMKIYLDSGALAQNVIWTVAGSNATIETNASFAGVLMTTGYIALDTNASVNGRLLSQTYVTLQQNTITHP